MSTRAQVAPLAHVPGALPDGHQDAQALALKLCERLSDRDSEGANALILADARGRLRSCRHPRDLL